MSHLESSEQPARFRGTLQAESVLRGYRIEAVLGCGGFGVVYRARHGELGHRVAIKEYLPADLSIRDEGTVYPRNPDCIEAFEDGQRRFLEEARQLVQLKDDPGVVTCTDFFSANGTGYLVMEYVEGLSLAQLCKQREDAGRPFGEADLKLVAVPLLRTLTRLHRAGILHRDIKPSNILLRRPDGQPVLIDFGAAKQLSAAHTKSAAPYTDGYAALEQVGEGELGPWTDVYGFGAVMWRIVAGGLPPWEPPHPKRVELRAAALLAGRPDPLPAASELGSSRFSPELLLEIDRCLTISAGTRPNDFNRVKTALDGGSQEEGSSEPPPMLERDQGAARKWPSAVLLAVVPVIVAIGVVWMVDRHPNNVPTMPSPPADSHDLDAIEPTRPVETAGSNTQGEARTEPVEQIAPASPSSTNRQVSRARPAESAERAAVALEDERPLSARSGGEGVEEVSAPDSSISNTGGDVRSEPLADLPDSIEPSPPPEARPPLEIDSDDASEAGSDRGSETVPESRVGSNDQVEGPQLLVTVEAEYTPAARTAGLEGVVELAVEVWEDGLPHNIRVVRSLGLGLDEKAIEAVKKWRFSPGKKDGKPVRVAATIEVSFRLL